MERLLTLYSEVQSTDVRWLWYLPEQPENVQRPGSEVVEKGMLT